MKYIFIILILLISFNSWSSICTTVGNGNWNDASNWDCGKIPTNGDIVIIRSVDLITITTNMYSGSKPDLQITVNGHLQFDGSGQLNLSTSSTMTISISGLVDAVNTSGGSQIQFGNSGGAEWKATDGPLTNVVIYDGWKIALSYSPPHIIYPDYISETIYIYSNYQSINLDKKKYVINIYDQSGKLLIVEDIENTTTWELNNGIYLLTITDEIEIKYLKFIF